MARSHRRTGKKSPPETQTLLLHSLSMVTGDPTIRIEYPCVIHPGVQVTVTEPGEAKWIYMTLPVTKGSLITGVRVACHRSAIQNNISRIRLIQQKEPVTAEVVHDEKIEKNIPSHCVVSFDCHVSMEKSIMMKICMEFSNIEEMIEFGSVEIDYVPEYSKKFVPVEIRQTHRKDASVYKLNKKNSVRQPSLIDLFFLQKKKKSISIK